MLIPIFQPLSLVGKYAIISFGVYYTRHLNSAAGACQQAIESEYWF
jgi:hypothetical protein